MQPIPKNKTEGYTESWKRERDRQTKFYQDTPYYGSNLAKKMYELIKQTIPSLIQVSHCGAIVQLTTYKQDADKARSILSTMFNSIVKQKTCPYTEYITTYIINKKNNTL
jgi:hypothetical protein